MRIKKTERKTKGGLLRATFPTGFKEWCKHYGSRLKVKIGKFPSQNRVPSDGEEEPAVCSDLTPSVPSSPKVSAFVDRLNEECPVPVVNTPPASLTIGETLQLLDEMETRDSTPGSPSPTLRTPPRSPFKEGMTQDLLIEGPPPMEEAVTSIMMELPEESSPVDDTTLTVTSQTVSEANTPPVAARPRFPTVTQKCPRKEYRCASPPPQP